MMRTHTCGQLKQDDLSKEVILCGWVAARRDHGKIIFIDLRDRYGITQVTFFPKPDPAVYEKAKKIRNEDVLKIKGVVNARPKGTENPKITTGFVEVSTQELEVLGPCDDLPFEIDDDVEVGEEIRLAYRYLDLRRKVMYDKLVLRHKFNQSFRDFLNSRDFLEVETPVLTKSTPEGARDYLVPSRLNPNKFYALPQSPQLFKQLLMLSGMDRYYQIVKCFRDEDLRKDRQPEFTQLDIEMSFVEEEDILSLMEEMFAFVFKKALDVDLKIPFPRISYKEAMEKYKSDKPDIGEGDYRFLWVINFPMFEYNDDEKRWQTCHHPFTSPSKEGVSFLSEGTLDKVSARAYDLVFNGEEIASGSIRIHTTELQKKIFDVLGISAEDAERKFGFLLRAFKYGAPPHGGIAFGLDRLYAIISKAESIREMIAFPKTQKGSCLLSDAPSIVEEKQLKELHLKMEKVEKEGEG
jgi:aspartyl-tRNA synthetase